MRHPNIPSWKAIAVFTASAAMTAGGAALGIWGTGGGLGNLASASVPATPKVASVPASAVPNSSTTTTAPAPTTTAPAPTTTVAAPTTTAPAPTTTAAPTLSPAQLAAQAALGYVTAHYPGSGTAQVLKNEPDVEKGNAVFDVRTMAPNGTIYVVHVSQASDAVLWANAAEGQVAPTTTVAAPTTTSTTPTPTTSPSPTKSPDSMDAPDQQKTSSTDQQKTSSTDQQKTSSKDG